MNNRGIQMRNLLITILSTALLLSACSKVDSEKQIQLNEAADSAKKETQESVLDPKKEAFTQAGFPSQVFWGDTHLHTSDSPDAFGFGARLDSEDAFRFARGEKVTSTLGIEAQLKRPLDFLVIADHAVALGLSREIYEGNPTLLSDPTIKRWSEMMNESIQKGTEATGEMIRGHSTGTNPEMLTDPKIMGPIAKSAWTKHGLVVDEFNQPGKFTAFVGYEFTPGPNGDNLHRVVMFRDGAEKTNTIMPFNSVISQNPENLWKALSSYEKSTGGQALAIPHNSNLSNGRMFAFNDFEGNKIDADYANRRARWEPLVEVTQIKGDSESHPFLSPNDEFSDYGDRGWDKANLDMSGLKTDDMLAADYVREALKSGLKIENMTGVNPFKFGMIGSTDSHTGLATADSDNFFGKHTGVEPSAKRAMYRDSLAGGDLRIGWNYLASGYAAVWAKDNTRESIFDAMLRKEVYGTTGPRIQLRFFGGYDFSQDDVSDIAKNGYAKGVPMGGDLSASKKAPTFLLSTMKDPDGANLDRIQIVKGWLDSEGNVQEKVYDVAWSDDRKVDTNGKVPPVGNTVDLSIPTYENSIGAAQFNNVWTDPDFNPALPAFYYVRVIEIPTPRWVAYDIVRYGAKVGEDANLISQERAYSSPIWYTPE